MPEAKSSGSDKPSEGPEKITHITAPSFYASSVSGAPIGNDVSLLFSRPKPAMMGDNPTGINAAFMEPMAVIDLSMATTKDLSLLLADMVAKHEAEWGEIETAFTRKRAAKK